MSIVGLTDKGASFPRIGILRKGAAKNGNRPGTDLKHFRFVAEEPDVQRQFEEAYGKEPTEIEVFLFFDDIADNFEAWQEEWVAGGLKHRCDGQTCVLWLDAKTNTYRTDPKPCPGGCKQVGRLSVLLPALGRVAFVTVLTTSKHDIMSLHQSLAAAHFLQQGRLRGIPMILSRREREISTPTADGKRARRKKSLLAIEPAHRYAIAALKAMDATPLLLPTGAPIEEEDEDEILDMATGELMPAKPQNGKARPPAIPAPDLPAPNADLFDDEDDGPVDGEATEVLDTTEIIARIRSLAKDCKVSESGLADHVKKTYAHDKLEECSPEELEAIANRLGDRLAAKAK